MSVTNTDKSVKFKVGDEVIISRFKNIFGKSYASNWFEEVFLKKLKMLFCRYRKETNQTEFKMEKVVKKKDDKDCVNWEDYNNSFNSPIDKKDLFSRTIHSFNTK